MSSDEIMKNLKGPRGTKVKVGIARRGVPDLIDFEITRDKIPLYSVDVAYMATDEIGYIKISKFARTTYEEFLDAISKLKERGLKKLILDLRSNANASHSSWQQPSHPNYV